MGLVLACFLSLSASGVLRLGVGERCIIVPPTVSGELFLGGGWGGFVGVVGVQHWLAKSTGVLLDDHLAGASSGITTARQSRHEETVALIFFLLATE